MEKVSQVLTISRKWNHPQIRVTVTNELISLEMDIEDFKEALRVEMGNLDAFKEDVKKEIGPITFVMKQETFSKKLDAAWISKKKTFDKILDNAIIQVLYGVKQESSKVIR